MPRYEKEDRLPYITPDEAYLGALCQSGGNRTKV